MSERQDDIELMDYFSILWRRKWVILLPTFVGTMAAAIISFLLPQVWEVDALIQPSKVYIKNESGTLNEFVFVDAKQIASQISGGSYNAPIAAEQKMDIRNFPKIKAESLRETKLIRVSIRSRAAGKAKAILDSLFSVLSMDLDGKAGIEVARIESQISSNQIERTRIESEIKTFKNKVQLTKARIVEIGGEMNDTRRRIDTLEKEQLSALKTETRGETEGLAMLLYSNEIQQSLRYLNSLNELLNAKKVEEENLFSEIDNREKRLLQIDNGIKSLTEQKGMVDFTKLVKEPVASVNPVSPNKKLIVAASFIGGLMIFMLFALFLEYIKRQGATP